jgi:hypothetical protein
VGRLIRIIVFSQAPALVAGCGCGDVAAQRQATITQLDVTSDPNPGQPFEIDGSRLPAGWGAVQMEQSKDFCGRPVTNIIVPQGHGIRIILAPTTRPIDADRAGPSEPTDGPRV